MHQAEAHILSIDESNANQILQISLLLDVPKWDMKE